MCFPPSDAVLQFRAFFRSCVRRYFLQRFRDAGVSPHQLQPLPFAPRLLRRCWIMAIHLHLDSYPVSGTTTLDSRWVSLCDAPTPYYAGAISSAILGHAGLADHVFLILLNFRVMHVGWLSAIGRLVRGRSWLDRFEIHRFVMIKLCRVCLLISSK